MLKYIYLKYKVVKVYNYYFKIKKNELEFEFSTDNLEVFNEKASYYLKRIFEKNEINIEEDAASNLSLSDDNCSQNKQTSSFEDKLNEALENPKTKVIEKQFEEDAFKTFYFEKNPLTNLNRFILCAFYLQTIENLKSFTLKQINNKLYPITNFPIDHPILEEAMAKGYIKLDENENINSLKHYILTKEGVNYYENNLII